VTRYNSPRVDYVTNPSHTAQSIMQGNPTLYRHGNNTESSILVETLLPSSVHVTQCIYDDQYSQWVINHTGNDWSMSNCNMSHSP